MKGLRSSAVVWCALMVGGCAGFDVATASCDDLLAELKTIEGEGGLRLLGAVDVRLVSQSAERLTCAGTGLATDGEYPILMSARPMDGGEVYVSWEMDVTGSLNDLAGAISELTGAGESYPQYVRDNFVSECTQSGSSKAMCVCMLDGFEEAVDFSSYAAMEVRITAGQMSEADSRLIGRIAASCQ